MSESTNDPYTMSVPVEGRADLGEALSPVVAESGTASQAVELERTITIFLDQMGSGVVSVSRVVNPLLQVWSVARDVDAVVAQPVEHLLTVLVGRSITTSDELNQTMTEVRAMLAEATPLATV